MFLNKLDSNEDMHSIISKVKETLDALGELKSQIKNLKGIYKDKDSHIGMFVKLEKAIELRKAESALQDEERLFKTYYGDLYKHTSTDWDEIKQHIENKKKFDNLIVGRNLPKEFCKAIATNLADRESMTTKIDAISGMVSKVKERCRNY